MKKGVFSFKRDKYKSARGGYSRLLDIYCRKCGGHVLVYQKDGPGNLRRMYLDRVFSPPDLTNLQHSPIKEVKILKCRKCAEVLGAPYVYIKERRKAFRLYQDAVIKKVRKIKKK